MGNQQIKINPDLYEFMVDGIGAANRKLDADHEKPELTGNMPSIKNTVAAFEDISKMIKKCNLMCSKLETNLRQAAVIMQKQDRMLAGKK